jgi:hypothetical protein
MRTKFLVADSIKSEPNGKLTIFGMFPDDTIVGTVPASYTGAPGEVPPGLDSLACLINVAGLAPGTHKIKGQLFDPAGKLNSETPAVDFEIAPGNSQSFPFNLQPFVVSAGAGTYTWKFRIDDTDCSHSFEVRLVKAAG